MKFRPFCSDHFKKVYTIIELSADIHKGTVSLCTIMYITSRGTSILGVGGVPCSKFDDFLAIFALAHSKFNQIA